MGFRPSFQDIVPFAGDKAVILKPFLETSFSESMLIPLSGEVRNSLCEILIRYLEFHTEQPIRVKSLDVLRELYR